MTVRVGIIGSGFARAAYLPALQHVPSARVVAIASARLERANEAATAFGVPHASDDWRALLRDHELDLVCIATPPDLHAPMTLAALEAGAHVLCEKPTAMDAAEARAMRDRAAELGRIGLIGHELRFDPNRRRVAEWIATGAIGEVLHAHVTHATPGWAARDGRHAPATGRRSPSAAAASWAPTGRTSSTCCAGGSAPCWPPSPGSRR
jgi:predicted dehydrogenase